MNIDRKFLFLMILCLLGISKGFGQDSKAKKIEIDGFTVIFKPSVKDVISARLFLVGGTANYAKTQEGIEKLALQTVVEGGTSKLSKIALSAEADKIGTEFSAGASMDYGHVSMSCIKNYWDRSWELYADIIRNPAFDSKEFGLIKDKLISQAKQEQSDPDAYLKILAKQSAFKDKNYAKVPSGTPESLKAISLEDARNYYKKVLGKKSCYLVVVGNVKEEDLRTKVKAALSSLSEGSPLAKDKGEVRLNPTYSIEDREIATNYIQGIMKAPARMDKESVALRLAFDMLYDRYFLELRTKRSLSYAPAAFMVGDALTNPYNSIYISTINPKESMQVMVDELNKVRKEGFSPKELADHKQTYLTYFLMNNETSQAQALSLGTSEVAGDYKLFEILPEQIEKVSLEDINKAFIKYSNSITWTYLGKKGAVQNEDFKQPSEVKQEKLDKGKM